MVLPTVLMSMSPLLSASPSDQVLLLLSLWASALGLATVATWDSALAWLLLKGQASALGLYRHRLLKDADKCKACNQAEACR